MHFKTRNPAIDFSKIKVPTELTSWPKPAGGVRRAAINTFGAGGTNGHAVIEEYCKTQLAFPTPKKSFLLKVSSATDFSLHRLALEYADYVEKHNPRLIDLAHTLLSRRSTHKRSLFCTARTHQDVIHKLRKNQPKISKPFSKFLPSIVLLFTGQGAQW